LLLLGVKWAILTETDRKNPLTGKEFHNKTNKTSRGIIAHGCFADLFKGQGLAENWYCGPMRKTMFLNSGSYQNLTPIRVMGYKMAMKMS